MALLFAGPISFCVTLVTAVGGEDNGGLELAPALFMGVFAVGLPLTTFVLGLLALREIETKPNVRGRPAALTGAVAGGLGLVWCAVVYTAVIIKHVAG
jgi:hypothetical protein